MHPKFLMFETLFRFIAPTIIYSGKSGLRGAVSEQQCEVEQDEKKSHNQNCWRRVGGQVVIKNTYDTRVSPLSVKLGEGSLENV